MSGLEIGSAWLVRAAAWPTSALDGFRATSSIETEDEYARELERERCLLFTRTAGDPRFMKALLIANPEVARAAQRWDLKQPRNKRARHTETTLYRFLARAVARPAPADLWAGVTTARRGERTEIRSERACYQFAPDLRVFRAMLRAIGDRPEARLRARWFANPTIRASTAGDLEYRVRNVSGFVEARVVRKNAGVAMVLETISTRRMRLDRLVDAIRERRALEETALRRLLDQMIDGGLLLGALDLPASFPSPWRALERAARKLDPTARERWVFSVSRLRAIADEVGDGFERLSYAEVEDRLRRARSIVAELASALGLAELELPESVLRADLVAPFSLTIGPELFSATERCVLDNEAFQEVLGLGSAFRASLRDRLTSAIGDGLSLSTDLTPITEAFLAAPQDRTWQAIAERAGANDEVVARIARLERAIGGSSIATDETPRAEPGSQAPLGCLVLTPRSDRFLMCGLLDEALPMFGRHAWTLTGTRQDATDLFGWLRKALNTIARESGLRLFELAGSYPDAPNVLAHPTWMRPIDPWSGLPSPRALSELRVCVDRARDAILIDGSKRRAAVLAPVAAPFAFYDPLARLLLLTGFHDSPAETIQTWTVTFALELERKEPTPPLLAGRSLIVRPRRTVLAGDRLGELLAPRGFQRFRRWRALARELGWPERVMLRIGDRPPLCVVTESPLATEAALEGARRAERIVIDESADSNPWLVAPDGGRYTIEVAIPFARSRHAWRIAG